jgi:hypothetical protein
LIPLSLEEMIGPENDVRVIDMFVDGLPLADDGFKVRTFQVSPRSYFPRVILPVFPVALNNAIVFMSYSTSAFRSTKVPTLYANTDCSSTNLSVYMTSDPIFVTARCPMCTTFELVGGKWKLLIPRQLFNRSARLSTLKRLIPDSSEKLPVQEINI